MDPHCALKVTRHLLKNKRHYHHNAIDRFGIIAAPDGGCREPRLCFFWGGKGESVEHLAAVYDIEATGGRAMGGLNPAPAEVVDDIRLTRNPVCRGVHAILLGEAA